MADEVGGVVKEILDALIPSFEALETQSAAVLQFLKEKGIATEDQLAPYLEQAANASNVRWRATRLRLEHLFSSVMKDAQKTAKKEADKDSNTAPEAESQKQEKSDEQGQEKSAQNIFGESGGKQTKGEETEPKEPEQKANEKPPTKVKQNTEGSAATKEEQPASTSQTRSENEQTNRPNQDTRAEDSRKDAA